MKLFKQHLSLFLGLGVSVFFLVLLFVRVDFFDSLELKFYDIMMSTRTDKTGTSAIVLVEIDNDSIEKLGRWPWPRVLLADVIDKISASEAKVIGLNIILSEPEKKDVINALERLEKLFNDTILTTNNGENETEFMRAMAEVRQKLDNDSILAAAIESSGKVVLPCFLKQGPILFQENKVVEPLLKQNSIANIRIAPDAWYPRSNEINIPIKPFMQGAKGVGHINLGYDLDGKARRDWPVYKYNDIFLPSYALTLAAAYLDIPLARIRVDLGGAIDLGAFKVPTTNHSELLLSFKGKTGSFKHYSFFDIYNDKIPAAIFKNKIVLISPSASGLINPLNTPTDNNMTLGEFTANAVRTILLANSIKQPPWGGALTLGMLLAVALLVTFIFPRLKAAMTGILFLTLVLVFLAAPIYLFASKGIWIQVGYPFLLLIVGYLGSITLKYFTTETGKELAEGESAETNRMLGHSFQSQGMLDMAFDKFRRVPMDEQLKNSIYNLGLDYERKRQFNKAAAAYEYIEQFDKNYKDIKDRKRKMKIASDTLVFGDTQLGDSTIVDDLLVTGVTTRPTLGRYEIIKQLGKGAMGIVYLGKDPRINRTTAIKTFTFDNELEAEERETLKENFFREAESAGTLSHNNIVTIYDAGEEQDLAYIAMEYLQGEDLTKYTKKDNLLPVRQVTEYMADIADALDYAHQKGIVHRDIKPSNIVMVQTGEVKITDFGVARITATSKTRTGVLKGTPSYMSPEQFAGKKVDGRSDIFSLGIMMFQLLTGQLPFQGNNLAELMHNIMLEPHPDPASINPEIPPPLVAILDKALVKKRENRYQLASQMSSHLLKVTTMLIS